MSDDASNDPIPVPSDAEGPVPTAAEGPAPPPMGEGPWGSLLAVEGSGRHDGWTGALMARFCETLAETGIVVDACLAVGKSTNTAYATRRRDPLFAAMWEAALGIARNRLADALLARSIEGSVETYYRDGELVGEKRHIDNRLGLAVLRRLDRLAETGSALPVLLRRQEPRPGQTGPMTGLSHRPGDGGVRSSAQGHKSTLDWDQMIGALRTGDPDAVATALAALKGAETRETHDPPDSLSASTTNTADDDEIEDVRDRVWDTDDGWRTDFPPPDDFDGLEYGQWGCYGYNRSCTDEECALLDAIDGVDLAGERAAQEADRTAYFADIAAEVAAATSSAPDNESAP